MSQEQRLAGISHVAVLAAILATGDLRAAELPRWMEGCWAGSTGARTFQEKWSVADNSTMLALSYTTRDGRLTEFEFLRIVMKGEDVVYLAQPAGAPPTEFAATRASPREIVFENPKHDFPKRIGYRRIDEARVTAWIDGGAGTRSVEFPMTRRSCAP